MKKILMAVCTVLVCAVVSAQEAAPAPAPATPTAPAKSAPWPVWLAFNSTKNIDVIGLRLTLPYGECEGVTGIDLGFYGRCRYFEGFQLNILRNEALDIMAGVQVGVYNSAGRADLTGLQVGLWNEARSIRGVQVGIINVADTVQGIQFGLINRTESMYGFQLGGVNVIRESELAFFPIMNVGFDTISLY